MGGPFGLVPVDDAFLGRQTVQELRIEFPVLHGVLARLVMAEERRLRALQAVFLQDRRQDLRRVDLLEDAAVVTQCQTRQRRLDDGTISSEPEAGLALLERGADADHCALGSAIAFDREHRFAIQQLRRIDRVIGAGKIQLQPERLRNTFGQLETDHIQRRSFAQREGEGYIGLHTSYP